MDSPQAPGTPDSAATPRREAIAPQRDPVVSTRNAIASSRALLWVALAVLLAAALSAWFWIDARSRIGATQDEIARRLREVEGEARDARSLARQAQDAQRDMLAKLGQIDQRLAESQSQQVALEALYQELSRNRDEWQLAEIEQVLAIASQQLQLSGNVRAALLALELAESRLARADRPQFITVRRALARDIERLKALPTVDLPGLNLRLEGLVAGVDLLPLAFDQRTERGQAARADAPAPGFFARLGADLWGELKQLVVVRRVDAPEAPLLPPTQAYFLRENLRLRLLNARVSLLTRDEAGYREDLRVADGWVKRYFDTRAKATRDYLGQLTQLSAAPLSLEMPSISESLEAIRNFKSRGERSR
jgi:uroporphyrin-3 C-methyltransferase